MVQGAYKHVINISKEVTHQVPKILDYAFEMAVETKKIPYVPPKAQGA
jgi:hypothetical protein